MDIFEQLEKEDKRFDEMNRIVNLPRISEITDEMQEQASKLLLLKTASWPKLNKVQVAAILSYLKYGGILGAIGVGWGKTFVSFKTADLAYAKGKKKILLLIPANCVIKTSVEIPELMHETALNLPIHMLGGATKAKRMKMSKEDSGLFIMSYEQLSLKDSSEVIRNIAPNIIIADECHRLAKPTSTCTMRIGRWMAEFPQTEFCGMSGTLTDKSLYDYAHITQWACKGNAPLPNVASELDNWCELLNSTFSEHVQGFLFKPLIDWAQVNFPPNKEKEEPDYNLTEVASLRNAYKKRFASAPGVVSSGDAQVNVSLLMQNNEIKNPQQYQGYDEILTHMQNVDDFMMNPSGEEIEYALHTFKYKYELTSGFFLELYWEDDEIVSDKLKISYAEASMRMQRSREHLEACQEYWASMRRWLQENACEGLDMPSMLEDSMLEHKGRDVGADLYMKYAYMKSKEFDDLVERAERSHRVCDYKVKSAVDFYQSLKKGTGCLFWIHHHELGRWLCEEFQNRDIPFIYADASKKGEYQILNKENAHLPIVASTSSHSTGKNLQHFQENYFVQFSRSSKTVEQAIGRTHRQGQKADSLIMNTNFTTEFDHQMFAAVMADSLYVAQTQNRQKLVYADYNPIPKKMSNALLKERGLMGIGDSADRILKGL